MLPDIDLSKIRPYGSSRNKAFEELSVQLFRSSQHSADHFYRVDDGGGDGGVEDIASHLGSGKVGMQAKFFVDKLEQTQWSQITRSAKKAIKTHSPDLIEYQIFCPRNRSKDTDTWDNYITKWNAYANEQGYTKNIKFTWVGETEILNYLSSYENRDKAEYWFGQHSFSLEWLGKKLELAENMLGERFTPRNNIRTASEQMLEAFFQTDAFKKQFLSLTTSVVNKSNELKSRIFGEKAAEVMRPIDESSRNFINAVTVKGFLDFSKTLELGEQMQTAIENSLETFENLARLESLSKDIKDNDAVQKRISYSTERRELSDLIERLALLKEYLNKFRIYESSQLLVSGEAGIGKSHLIANAIRQSLRKGQPAVMLLGEVFHDGDSVMQRSMISLGWENGANSFLRCLNVYAEICGQPAIIAIDAVNESTGRNLWKNELLSFSQQVAEYKHLRLLISCRSDFNQLVLPPSILGGCGKWNCVLHQGFNIELFEAVTRYFEDYGVRWHHFPQILEEFKNPLFLKTFCETFKGQELPEGVIGLDLIFKRRLQWCKQAVRTAIDCPEYKVDEAIHLLAEKIGSNEGTAYPRSLYQPKVDQIFDGGGESRSLYRHLRANGIIVETLLITEEEGDDELAVRFAFERFSDYFVCSRLLDSYASLDELRIAWRKNGLPHKWISEFHYFLRNRGLLKMMAVLLPERFGVEFIELFEGRHVYSQIQEDFCLLYTSPSPRDQRGSRMPSSA